MAEALDTRELGLRNRWRTSRPSKRSCSRETRTPKCSTSEKAKRFFSSSFLLCLYFFARSVFRENSGSDGVFFVEERQRVQKREKERRLLSFSPSLLPREKVEKNEKQQPQTARVTNNPYQFFFFSSFFFPHTNTRNERENARFPTPLQKKRETQKRRAKGKRQRETASGSARRLFFPSASRFFSSSPPFFPQSARRHRAATHLFLRAKQTANK